MIGSCSRFVKINVRKRINIIVGRIKGGRDPCFNIGPVVRRFSLLG